MSRFRLPGDKLKGTLLRFETKEHLQILLTHVFGVTGRMGVRSHPPKLSDAHGTACKENTAINFVQGSNEVKFPFHMYTKRGGVDIVYSLDGFIKISARYMKYLLHLDKDGHPVACPSPVLVDILLHFPTEQVLANVQSDDKDDESYDDPLSAKHDVDDNTTLSSQKLKGSDDLASLSSPSHNQNSSCLSSNSLSSYFAVGTRFRFRNTGTIWEIRTINTITVNATVIHCGTDLTLEDGSSSREFLQSDKTMRNGLVEYNS